MRRKKEEAEKEIGSSDSTPYSAMYNFESQLCRLGTVRQWVLLVITLKAAVFKDILNFPCSQDVGF